MGSEPVTMDMLLTLIREMGKTSEERQQEQLEFKQEHATFQQEQLEFKQEHVKFQQEQLEFKQEHVKFQQEHAKFQQEQLEFQRESEKKRLAMEAAFEERHKRIQAEITGIGKSNGEYAEQFFQRAISKDRVLGGKEYDDFLKNLQNDSKRGTAAEYDVVLRNGDSIAIIEIKYKFKKNDMSEFLGKINVFRTLFPEYKEKKIYLGIAAFSFEEEVIKRAKELGIGILYKDGKVIQRDDANLKEFLLQLQN